MLAALLMAFFLGGGTAAFGSALTQEVLDDVDQRVQAAVVDPVRSEQAAAQIDVLRTEVGQFEKTFGKSSKTLAKLYRDHGTDPMSLRRTGCAGFPVGNRRNRARLITDLPCATA